MTRCGAVAAAMGQCGKHCVCVLAGTLATLCCDGYESQRERRGQRQGTTCQIAVKEAVDAELELRQNVTVLSTILLFFFFFKVLFLFSICCVCMSLSPFPYFLPLATSVMTITLALDNDSGLGLHFFSYFTF